MLINLYKSIKNFKKKMMYTIFNKICKQYYEIWDSRDARLNHMPFVHSPWPMLLLVSAYVFIIGTGKKWMAHRQPMQIDRIIIAYNFIQIIANSMLVLMITIYIFADTNFSFRCEPIRFATDSMGMYLAYLAYVSFILKLFDYLDTVFFILRKKWTQISFLHVYHHVFISVIGYYGLLYAPGGQAIVVVCVNCFVHAVMYTYYLLVIYKPMGIKPSVTMKKNITRLQIIQFFILAIHFGHGFVIPGHDCGYPKFLSFLGVAQNLFFITLFTNFYRHAYGNRKKDE